MANLTQALYSAMIGNSAIMAKIATYKTGKSVHTRRPPPSDATYPMLIISPHVGGTNDDLLVKNRSIVMRNILVYGNQPTDFHTVNDCADLVKKFLHRNRFALSITGFHVVDIQADEPQQAPTSSEDKYGVVIPIMLRLREV